jgi:glycosyltransferase involved in cell wall biosynthesis
MIPRVAHFVFGLKPQKEPFHFLRYVALESCRRVLDPETIWFHHKHLPTGPWWERIRPHLSLAEIDLVPEVLAADYSTGRIPPGYRYAHHADFIRLDVLLEHGGIYADIDTIFVRPLRDELFEAPFVIGREHPVHDERTGAARPSLCNALLMAERGSQFTRAWRDRMPAALDGTWSNHSGFLAQELSEELPDAVHVEPEEAFYPFPATELGVVRLLEERHAVPAAATSVHLWAHLWWESRRRDFSEVHAGSCTPDALEQARTTLADLARPYLPTRKSGSAERWTYLSLDGYDGYAVAGIRCIDALAESGIDIEWAPTKWDQPSAPFGRTGIVVAHLVPETYWHVRERNPDAFLVGHTAWETDRLPEHWPRYLAAADLLVVPSTFSRAPFTGLSTPVVVVPHVARPVIEARSPFWEGIPPDTFVFYTVAEWTERKAVFKTIEAYLRAFSSRDKVLLIVKTSRHDARVVPAGDRVAARGTTAWALAELLSARPDPPEVRLITAPLSHRDMDALHRRADCFVSLARGEGWGLGDFDAATYGNPVVTTGYGGQLDYLGDSATLVRFDLVEVVDPVGGPSYTRDQHWADPDVEHAASLLQAVAATPSEAMEFARARAEEIRRRYAPAVVAAEFREAVESLRG